MDVIVEDVSTVPSPCDPEIPNSCCNQELLNYLNSINKNIKNMGILHKNINKKPLF